MDSQDHVHESTSFFHDGPKNRPAYIIIIGIASVAVGAVLLVVASVLYSCTGGKVPYDYGIVIDGGSTHTDVFLYQWLGSKDYGTGDVLQKESCSVGGGIAVMPDPTDILPCVSNVTQSVPKSMISSTPLYLGATAGMRLLNMTDSAQAKLILLALRYALIQEKVNVTLVDIIKGYEEGLAAWITVNYLLKSFTSKQLPLLSHENPWHSTSGALDMGGASTQIAFAIDPTLQENYTHTSLLKLYGNEYHIVSESFLCFGMMQAFYRHQALLLINKLNSTSNIPDPCLPKGNFSKSSAGSLLGGPCTQNPTFESWLEIKNNRAKEFTFEGTSDFEGCHRNIVNMLNFTACGNTNFPFCPRKFSISGAPDKFVAFSSYYYMTHFLNSTNVSLPEFVNNTKSWCGMTWDEIKHHKYRKSDLSHLTQYCFGALYIIGWLTNIYGFDENSWSNISFQNKVGDYDVGWTLGYMINATNLISEEPPSSPVISTIAFSCLVLCSISVAVIGIMFIRGYCKKGYQYSQMNHERLSESA